MDIRIGHHLQVQGWDREDGLDNRAKHDLTEKVEYKGVRVNEILH